MKSVILASAFILGLNGHAAGQETGFNGAVAVQPGYNWSGVYAGLHGGYQWQRHRTGFTGTDTGSAGIFSFYQQGYFVGSSDAPEGALIGGQLGYNHRMNSMIVGVEADLSYLRAESSKTLHTSTGSGPNDSKSTREINYIATVRARLGYLPSERLMLFATGGLALGNSRNSYTATIDGPNPLDVSPSREANAGYAVGAGAEYGLNDRWSIKAEYLYYDLGKTSWTAVDRYNHNNYVSTMTGTTRNDGSIVRIGLNYRFGGG